MKSEGLDFSSARRALNEAVRRCTSADVSVSAPAVFGKMTGEGWFLALERPEAHGNLYLLLEEDTYSVYRPLHASSHPLPSTSQLRRV